MYFILFYIVTDAFFSHGYFICICIYYLVTVWCSSQIERIGKKNKTNKKERDEKYSAWNFNEYMMCM